MDECGLAQGFSFIFSDYAYPTNHSSLLKSCKRQSEAFKCLKQYSKCLTPLSRQVLSAIIAGRIKYNKKLCAETVGEFNGKFIDTFKCMSKIKPLMEKGVKAEIFASVISEGIANTKLNSSDIRLKHACCAVSEIKRVSLIVLLRLEKDLLPSLYVLFGTFTNQDISLYAHSPFFPQSYSNTSILADQIVPPTRAP